MVQFSLNQDKMRRWRLMTRERHHWIINYYNSLALLTLISSTVSVAEVNELPQLNRDRVLTRILVQYTTKGKSFT